MNGAPPLTHTISQLPDVCISSFRTEWHELAQGLTEKFNVVIEPMFIGTTSSLLPVNTPPGVGILAG